ncbi:MAG: hypothetical protein LBD75_04770 [Candidatus Peribacteria bacterium]|jgi:hypothetical protein|nr:hypothetical protein [Candidatus Peribacteria bacterium]
MTAEADRHELELQNALGKTEKKAELNLEPATAAALNQLAKDFLEGKVNEIDFKKKFNDLITNDNEVKRQRGTHKVDFVGSNLLEKLKRTKKEREIRGKVATLITNYTSGTDTQALDKIMGEINTFTNEFKTDPSFRKEIFGGDGKIDAGKFEQFIKHHKALEQIGLNNLKIKLDLLSGGEGAYQINNKDRESKLYKFGHWMDKHPWITGLTMAGLTLGTGGIVGAAAGAVAAGWATAGVVGGTVGFKNFVAKWTHHTKEQNTHEKDLTRDFTNVQKKMDQWRADLAKYGKWSRKGYKAKRQLELYENTTQSTSLFGDTKQLADAIMNGVTATTLTNEEKNSFNFDVLKAYARLDFYRRQGHNFLKSEDANQIEQDFLALEKALQLVAERNGGTQMTEIPAIISATDPSSGKVINYDELRAEFEKDYSKARTTF